MRIETMILNCLKKQIPGLCESDALLCGISEYTQDNNLISLLKDEQATETTEFMVSLFLDPFFKMPVQVVNSYFENYTFIKRFQSLSNTVLEFARNKYSSHNVLLPNDVEENVIKCIAEIYMQKGLETAFAAEISDILLELDYINGKTDKLSIRLARMVK